MFKFISETLDEIKEKVQVFDELLIEKVKLIKQLRSITAFKEQIPLIEQNLKTKKQVYTSWIASLDSDERELYITKKLTYAVTKSTLNELKGIISNAKSGMLGKIIFNWFKKAEFIKALKTMNQGLAIDLQKHIDNHAPIFTSNHDKIEGFHQNINFINNQVQRQAEYSTKIELLLQEINGLETDLQEKKAELLIITKNESKIRRQKDDLVAQQPAFGLKIMELTIHEKLRTANSGVIEKYKGFIQNGIPYQKDLQFEVGMEIKSFLEIFNAISITSLNIKKGFIQEAETFDLLVIDEASQCDITSVLPLIYRAKRVVVIGDSLQLPHITSIKRHEQQFVLEKLNLPINTYNYIQDSLFEKAKYISNLSLLDSAFLDEHYRCHPDIIGFNNEFFYKKKAGHELDVKTNDTDFNLGNPGINWADVKGKIDASKNVNMDEVNACISLIQQLVKDFPNASIGVATAFKHQKEELKKAMNDLPFEQDILCDVIHNFQGDEKDIIILSLVVTDNCKDSLPRFINEFSPYLLNVAVSRAKSALYVVGNKEYCLNLKNTYGHKTLLTNLAEYEIQKNTKPEKTLEASIDRKMNKRVLIQQAIDSNQGIVIDYQKNDGTHSTRQLSNICYNNSFEIDGFQNDHIQGMCSLRGEDRTFKIDRIKSIEIIE